MYGLLNSSEPTLHCGDSAGLKKTTEKTHKTLNCSCGLTLATAESLIWIHIQRCMYIHKHKLGARPGHFSEHSVSHESLMPLSCMRGHLTDYIKINTLTWTYEVTLYSHMENGRIDSYSQAHWKTCKQSDERNRLAAPRTSHSEFMKKLEMIGEMWGDVQGRHVMTAGRVKLQRGG